MRILIPILTLFLIGCSLVDKSKTEKKNKSIKKETIIYLPPMNDEFKTFLDNFPKLELPIKIKGCETGYENLTAFDEENPSPYIQDFSYALGQIPANGKYISVITLGVTDCLLPIITTFSQTGEKIDSKTIAIGHCGDGPCFECIEFMTLKKDFTIYIADTMITSDCDEEYNPIVGTENIEVIYKNGRLTETGKIELSQEFKKNLKN